MTHKHWPKDHPAYEAAVVCTFSTMKQCNDVFADWQADQTVNLAARVAKSDSLRMYSRDASVFGQMVNVLAGRREAIEGNAAFTVRLRAALARHSVIGGDDNAHP